MAWALRVRRPGRAQIAIQRNERAIASNAWDDYCEMHGVPVPKGEPVYISRIDADGQMTYI